MGLQEVDDLVRKMMDIDDNMVIPGLDEFVDDMVQQRLPADRHERLGHRVRQGFQAGTQPRGKDHRFHRAMGRRMQFAHSQLLI